MSIQFRCVHCRQLLGISNSRAGTQVDCPACGRTLRVPRESGGQAAPIRTASPQIDAGLLGALEELAGLSEQTSGRRPSDRKASPGPSTPLDPPVARKRENLRIVPIKPQSEQDKGGPGEPALFESPERVFEQLANLPPATQNDEPLILKDSDSSHEAECPLEEVAPIVERMTARSANSQLSPEHTGALAELAASVMPPRSASMDQSSRATNDERAPGGWSMAKLAVVLGLTSASFLGGLATGIYKNPFGSVMTPQHADLNEQTVLKHTMEPTEPSIPEPAAVEFITGKVTYVDDSGVEKPDANALVLLLPSRKDTELKLDAGPLRDITMTPGRSAVEAALGTLGASVIRTDEAGQFKMPRRTSGPASLVVVSRHSARKDSNSTTDDVSTTISSWLENPAQVIGRLATQTRPLSEVASGTIVPPFVIQFDSKK